MNILLGVWAFLLVIAIIYLVRRKKVNTRKDWSPKNGEGWRPKVETDEVLEGPFQHVRVWQGRALTAEEVRSVYSHVGADSIQTNLRVIRPHAHECATCRFLWYCEKDDIPENYIPAVPSDGWPTSPDGHDCSEYQGEVLWYAKGDE